MKSFTTDPLDLMCFGMGSAFDAKSVQSFLNLKLDEVYRITEGIPTAVHLEDAMPDSLIESLQEIAIAINWVAKFFGGDVDKTTNWFNTPNPSLGDISPKDMIRLGRFERLNKFILYAMTESDKATVPIRVGCPSPIRPFC
jgi:hypothetical protein